MSVAPATALPTYDWAYPAIPQQHDWDCSQESIRWCLFAWGRSPDNSWMEASMIAAGVVSPSVGCTDASGAGLAGWVNDEYAEYGYWAENEPHVTFDDLATEARLHVHGMAIGGRGWYHWSGLASYDELLDQLVLRNPAPGYRGVYQTLSRAQFDQLGPFSAVRVTHPEAEGRTAAGALLPPGIDVASHQGWVDWAAVRNAGCQFGFTKATGGAWYTNGTLAANWAGMQAAGLKRGAYHYAFESSGQVLPGPGPVVEADFFLNAVAPLGIGAGDMLVLDIEEGIGDVAHWALEFCRRVEAQAGFKPLIYSGAWFTDPHHFGAVPELAAYPLWLAAYQATMPQPPKPWTAVDFWQFTDRAQVSGVQTPVDGNWFNGDLDALHRHGKPGVAPSTEDPYLPWRGLVGSGLLDMMAVDGTLPAASRSTWLPLGQTPADIETCMGLNGIDYRWTVSSTNQGFRYAPL